MALSILFACGSACAAESAARRLGLHGAREIFNAACAACHGPDGSGTDETIAGFQRPDTFPHFNACDESAPESTEDWEAVIRDGGAARGFAHIMPAFGSALSREEIRALAGFLRGLCREPDWPNGELNVPRALVTEKAAPESETVLTATVNAQGQPGLRNELAYERMVGRRGQLEISLPFGWMERQSGGSSAGFGDLALGYKHVVAASAAEAALRAPEEGGASILSVQAEVVLPTGSERRGLGTGQTVFEAFAAYDRLLPARAFLQWQLGAELPRHTDSIPNSLFLNVALGRTINDAAADHAWTPMLEVLADRDLESGAVTHLDLLPEFQLTLSRRRHVRWALGYRVPTNDTANRPRTFMTYLLWDWFDGGLLEGWR